MNVEINDRFDCERPIEDLINYLKEMKKYGAKKVELIIEKDEIDLDTESGSFDYVYIPKIKIS